MRINFRYMNFDSILNFIHADWKICQMMGSILFALSCPHKLKDFCKQNPPRLPISKNDKMRINFRHMNFDSILNFIHADWKIGQMMGSILFALSWPLTLTWQSTSFNLVRRNGDYHHAKLEKKKSWQTPECTSTWKLFDGFELAFMYHA